MQRLIDFIKELKRRKVFQVASVYLVTAWGASLGAAELLPAFGAPEGSVRSFVIILLLLFPVVIALAWYFEITEKGVVLDSTARAASESALEEVERGRTTMVAMVNPDSHVSVFWEESGRAMTNLFDHDFDFGRGADCAVSTLDPRASRRHARVERRADGWWVVDLDSSNGVLLDGAKVALAPLPAECELQLGAGGARFKLRVEDRNAETRISMPDGDPPAQS